MLPSFLLQAGVSSLRAMGAESLVPSLAQGYAMNTWGFAGRKRQAAGMDTVESVQNAALSQELLT